MTSAPASFVSQWQKLTGLADVRGRTAGIEGAAGGTCRSRSTSLGSPPSQDSSVAEISPSKTDIANSPSPWADAFANTSTQPSAFFIRNTFIDAPVTRPPSLEGFLLEREVRTCPASREVSIDDMGLGFGLPPGLEDMFGCLEDFDTPQAARINKLPLPAVETRTSTRPGPRGPRHCVGLHSPPMKVAVPEPTPSWPTDPADDVDEVAVLPWDMDMFFSGFDDGSASIPMFPATMSALPCHSASAVPPPPVHWAPSIWEAPLPDVPDILAYSQELDHAQPAVDASVVPWFPRVGAGPVFSTPAPQVLHLERFVGEYTGRSFSKDAIVGSAECPTAGSAGHHGGECRPCAFMHTKGCQNGLECPFCHLCPPGEKKARKKEKKAFRMTGVAPVANVNAPPMATVVIAAPR